MSRAPFYHIFDALRKNGFPLGVDEYFALLEVLTSAHLYTAGENIIDKTALLGICKTLWLKPNQVPLVFETIFNQQYERIFAAANITNFRDNAESAADKSHAGETRPELNAGNATPDSPVDESTDVNPALKIETAVSSVKGVRIVAGAGTGQPRDFKKDRSGLIEKRFLFSDNYFPVSRRQIQQIFSYLPLKKQRPAENEIDVDGAIAAIARDGYLKAPIFKSRTDTINRLVILHDHNGSMVAFEKLSDMLGDAAHQMTHNFYFQQITDKHLYLNKARTRSVGMDAFIDYFREKKAMLIIHSDAGAARLSNSDTTVIGTIHMIKKLRHISSQVVWLNPFPANRWVNTSAERIAGFVPMFPVDQAGLQQAVAVLRGKQVKSLS